MNLLLDTCALLWFLSDDPQLSANARSAIQDRANVRWLPGATRPGRKVSRPSMPPIRGRG